MTLSQVVGRRMRSSRLVGPPSDSGEEVVRWHGAMQAQDYGLAKWSIGQRAADLFEADLDRALAEGSILRTHVLRPTWHFVAREDLRCLLALTGPRVQRHNARRYRELGLDARELARSESLFSAALQGGNRLTRAEVGKLLIQEGIDPSGQRLAYILMHGELEAVICSGGLAGRQHTYALFDERVPAGRRFDRDEALVELARRFLGSHGPATVKDLSWWSSLTVASLKEALYALGSEVRKETVEEFELWSRTEAPPPRGRTGVRLLPAYDELIVGYTESRFLGDPRAAAARAAWRDRSLPSGVVLVGGGVSGHWRRVIERDTARVEILLYDDPRPGEVRALERATEALGRFMARPVRMEVEWGIGSARRRMAARGST